MDVGVVVVVGGFLAKGSIGTSFEKYFSDANELYVIIWCEIDLCIETAYNDRNEAIQSKTHFGKEFREQTGEEVIVPGSPLLGNVPLDTQHGHDQLCVGHLRASSPRSRSVIWNVLAGAESDALGELLVEEDADDDVLVGLVVNFQDEGCLVVFVGTDSVGASALGDVVVVTFLLLFLPSRTTQVFFMYFPML